MTMKDRLPLVTDLLMEAAHADNRLEGEETEAVKRLLTGILEVSALPIFPNTRSTSGSAFNFLSICWRIQPASRFGSPGRVVGM